MTDQTDITSADDRPVGPLLTLTEASIVTGRPPEAIRTMIRRHKLAARKGNNGKWLVEIPVDMKRPVGQDHGQESWLGEFGQGDRWRFCLTAAGMARAQERR